MQYIQISTTVSKKSDAARIAKLLSDKKFSACTQIIATPIITGSKEYLRWIQNQLD